MSEKGNYEFEQRKNARIYDCTQPLVFDNSPFARAINAELTMPEGRPVEIVEFGCGTGLLSMKVLHPLASFNYRGFDISAEMAAIFRQKLQSLLEGAPQRQAEVTDSIDLRFKASTGQFSGRKADYILISQFLQYLPLQTDDEQMLSKSDFITICISMLRPGGKLFILEDIHGETAEEHLQLSLNWDRVVIENYSNHLPELEQSIGEIDPTFIKVIRRMIAKPQVMKMIREKRRAARNEMIIPLSAWQTLLSDTGKEYHMKVHDQLKNFYLFTLNG